MKNKLTFTAQIIQEEEIPSESYGYSKEYVDKFLDNIVEDYDKVTEFSNEFEKKLQLKEDKIDELEKALDQVTNQKNLLDAELEEIKKGGSTDYTNVLKRMTQTEEKIANFEDNLESMLDLKFNELKNLILK